MEYLRLTFMVCKHRTFRCL